MISQKITDEFFLTFPECSLPSTVSKDTIKIIGHHVRLRDVTSQSYPNYACARAKHTRYSLAKLNFAVAGSIVN